MNLFPMTIAVMELRNVTNLTPKLYDGKGYLCPPPKHRMAYNESQTKYPMYSHTNICIKTGYRICSCISQETYTEIVAFLICRVLIFRAGYALATLTWRLVGRFSFALGERLSNDSSCLKTYFHVTVASL